MQGCHPEGKSFSVVGEEDWRPGAVPAGLEKQCSEALVSAPSPASAEGWACFPGNTGPGSGGKCLEDQGMFGLSGISEGIKRISEEKFRVFMTCTFKQFNGDILDKLLPPAT